MFALSVLAAAHFLVAGAAVTTLSAMAAFAAAGARHHESEREGEQAEEQDLGPVGVHEQRVYRPVS
jgi:hypothetical protein